MTLTKITVTNYRNIHNEISFNLNNSFNIFTCNYDKVEDSIISLIKLFYKILTVGGAVKDFNIKENTCIEYEFKVSENIYILTIKDFSFNFSDMEFPSVPYTNCIDSNIMVWDALNDINLSKSYLNSEKVNSTEGIKEQIYHTDYHNCEIKNIMQHLLLLEHNKSSLLINQLDHVHPELLIEYLPPMIQIAQNRNIPLYIFSNNGYILNILKLLINKKKLNRKKVVFNCIYSSFGIANWNDSFNRIEIATVLDSGEFGMIHQDKVYNTTPTSFISDMNYFTLNDFEVLRILDGY